MLFMNKHHKVSFSYHFIFDIIMCVLVTFYKRGHFVILIIKSMHLIKVHFWTYLLLYDVRYKIQMASSTHFLISKYFLHVFHMF